MSRKPSVLTIIAIVFLALAIAAGVLVAMFSVRTKSTSEQGSPSTVESVETESEPEVELSDTDSTIQQIFSSFDRSKAMEPVELIERFSYTLGYITGLEDFFVYKNYRYPEALDYFGILGAYDAQFGSGLYNENELKTIISEYSEDYNRRVNAVSENNLAQATAFLATNGAKYGVSVTESGLQYEKIKEGKGAYPGPEDKVELDYKLTLLDGTVVDSSYDRGEHSVFAMNQVIAGFSEGVQLMPLGSHYIFYVHPDLGYGSADLGTIGPNSLLIFEVETYSIKK